MHSFHMCTTVSEHSGVSFFSIAITRGLRVASAATSSISARRPHLRIYARQGLPGSDRYGVNVHLGNTKVDDTANHLFNMASLLAK